MREILLVGLSAILGYIVFSAFNATGSSQEAFRKIIEQPQQDMKLQQEIEFSKLANEKEARLIVLDNEHKKEQLHAYENIKISEKEQNTKVELKEIDYKISSNIASMKYQAKTVETTQRSYIYILIAVLLFLLVFIYLKYQKYLSTMELEKENEYREMIAKKEYAEKILGLLATGNLNFETERKLLKVLDEINGKKVEENNTILYHPNPEIAQLSSGNEKKYLDM